MVPDTLGALLEQLRERAGLSVAEVKKRTGFPLSSVYRWHTRTGRPELDVLQKLLDFYGATPSETLLAFRLRARPPEPRDEDQEATDEGDAPAFAARGVA